MDSKPEGQEELEAVRRELDAALAENERLKREKAEADQRLIALLVKLDRRGAGRPKRTPDPGERVQLSLRVTPRLKELIDAKADETGRSQSQEAEYRLEQTFQQEALVFQALSMAFGSREIAGLLIILGLAVRRGRQNALDKAVLSQVEKLKVAETLDAAALAVGIDAAHTILEGARRGMVGALLSVKLGVTSAEDVLADFRVVGGISNALRDPGFATILKREILGTPGWITGETRTFLEALSREITILSVDKLEERFKMLASRCFDGGTPIMEMEVPASLQSRAS
jgi:hypothetical protein